MSKGRVGLAVVPVAIIVLAIAWTAKSHFGGPQPPAAVLAQPVEKIDMKTLKILTKPMSEWLSLGHQGNRYKNPETGEYTLVAPRTCAACGQQIPEPAYPKDIRAIPPDELAKIEQDYVCPKCGGHPFGPHPAQTH
jgi:rRNA maturation protein Nop10